MHKIARAAIAAAGLGLIAASSALAQDAKPVHLRGTIEKVDGNTLQVKSREGATLTVKLKDGATVTADGFLTRDGLTVYEMRDFTLRVGS